MSKIEVDTIDTVTGTSELTIGGTNATSITLGSGASFSNISGQNYPAFEAQLSATQSITNNTATKVEFDQENLDTDSCYDNATNYRFTPTVAGKYFCYCKIRVQSDTNSTQVSGATYIYKNGVNTIETREIYRNNYLRTTTQIAQGIISFNGSTDYIEGYGFIEIISGGIDGVVGSSTIGHTIFGAYRIGA